MRLRSICSARLFAAIVVLQFWAAAACAHDVRPLIVEITESAPNSFLVAVKKPISVPDHNMPEIIMPPGCAADPRLPQLRRCSEPVAGRALSIRYPDTLPYLSTLIRFNRYTGEHYNVFLKPEITTWSFPRPETRLGVAKQYTFMGIEHILIGIDHLLFLAGILLIARTWRRILITVTGFTIAHSFTLILSTLNVVRLPAAPVEAAIALSIVFVAAEIARGNRETITYRYPIAVASSFGLLHGFGFAAVLREIGLPQKELLTGLLFFNVGVEIGQLMFVGAIVLGVSLVRVVSSFGYEQIFRRERLIAYGVGILASWWMFQRIVPAL